MTDTVADKPQRERDKSGRFLNGHKAAGPGRPIGSRHKLEELFVADYCAAWAKHGAPVLEYLATKEPGTFAKVAAAVLPKHTNATHTHKLELMSDQELAHIIAECEQEIGAGMAQRGKLN